METVHHPEVVKNEITEIIEKAGLEKKSQSTLIENFTPLFDAARQWQEDAQSIVVTDETQTDMMKKAREIRLELKKIRVNADKVRKSLKEDALRYGKAVQGVYNVIEYLIVPQEKYLEEQEKFAELQEQKRKEELTEKRQHELEPYAEYVPVQIDLAEMSEEDYRKLYNGAKYQHEARLEAERTAEEERIAREKAEEEERERIRKENERLKKEREDMERQAAAERAEREKKEAEERKKREEEEKARLEKERNEREERERLESEKRALIEKENRRIAEEKARKEAEERARIEAERKAAAAPDVEKIKAFADTLIALKGPQCATKQAHSIVTDAMYKISQIAQTLYTESEKLK